MYGYYALTKKKVYLLIYLQEDNTVLYCNIMWWTVSVIKMLAEWF